MLHFWLFKYFCIPSFPIFLPNFIYSYAISAMPLSPVLHYTPFRVCSQEMSNGKIVTACTALRPDPKSGNGTRRSQIS